MEADAPSRRGGGVRRDGGRRARHHGRRAPAQLPDVGTAIPKVTSTVNKIPSTVNKIPSTVNKVTSTANKVTSTVNKVTSTVKTSTPKPTVSTTVTSPAGGSVSVGTGQGAVPAGSTVTVPSGTQTFPGGTVVRLPSGATYTVPARGGTVVIPAGGASVTIGGGGGSSTVLAPGFARAAPAAGLFRLLEPPAPPASVANLLVPFPIVLIEGSYTRRGVRVRRLSVQAPPGARTRIVCLGRRCPRRGMRQSRIASAGPLRAVRFKRFQRRFSAGASISIYITKPGKIGKYTRFKVRKGKPPTRVDACVMGTARKPSPCPSS